MVKNLNTVERGEKVRIGKLQPHTQAENSVIVNASDTIVQAPHSGTFVSPIRYDTVATTNVLAYDTATNEIVTTQVVAVDKTLQYVTETGNTTTEVVQFTNGFVSPGPVGLAGNTEPAHSLDIGSNVYIDDTSSSGNVFFARGNVYIEGNLTTFGETTLIYSQNISVKDPIIELGQNNVNENLLYDLGVLMKRPGENVGVVYREAQDELFVGYTPNTASERFITSSSNLVTMNVVGDVYANAYFGDGRTLTGVAFKAHLEDNVSRIEVLETDAYSNALRVSNLETQMSSNGIRVGNLESNLAANSVRISNLEFNLQNNSQRISTLTAYHTSNVLRIQDLEANVNTNIHTRLNNLESNLTDNSNRITTLSARLEDNSFRISVNTANIANLQVTSSNNFANIATLQADALSNSIRVSTLETDLLSNAIILTDAVSNLAANSARISALEVLPAQLVDNSARIAALEVDPEFEGIITGDGGNISNLTLQYISDMGNTTSNTLHLTGGVSLKTDGFVGINVEPQYELHVGGDIQVDGNLNSSFFTTNGTLNRIYGNTLVDGNTTIQGNLVVHGSTSYLYSENVFIRDPILGLGNNGLADTGIIIGVQSPANVVFGYDASETEFIVAHSTASVDGVSLTPDPSNPINFHVYGDVEANTITSQADVIVGGNLEVRGNTTFLQVDNLAVDDAIIKIAAGNELTTLDSGVVMERAEANVAMVYRGHEDELMFAYTTDDAAGVDITPDLSKHMNVHVYGSFFADKSINVNSNTFISETGEVTANIYFGDGGLLSNITQTLQGITDIGNTTSQTLLLTNTNEAINATSNIVTDGYYFGNGEFLTGISNAITTNQYISSNVNILNDNIDSNISTVRDYITSNVNILNDNISSNLSTVRTYITSNVNILNENIDSNISTVRDYISSNVDILNENIDSNLSTVRTYITSNVNILNENIDSNISAVRDYISSNVDILNDNIDSNLSTARDYITSNVNILNENIDSNISTVRDYISSNVDILNDNIDSNISTVRTYITSNVNILNDNIDSNLETVRTYITSNVNILNDNIDSNLSTVRTYITSNVNILNDNISTNLETTRTYITSNVNILNENIDSNLSTVRTYITSNVNILNDNIDSNISTVRDYISSNVNILNDNIDSNLSTARDYITSNVNILNDNISSNLETTRTYISSNVNILNENIDSNLSTVRTYITSNVNILNDNISTNLETTRTYITSNVNILNDNIDSNLSTVRTYITSNVNILNENIDSNISTVRDYISSNVNILNENIDSNLSTARDYITSNVNILNDNIDSNLETTRTYITSNVNILNENIDSNLSTARDYITSNVNILNDNIDSNLETTRTYITSNVNILNENIDSNISTVRDYISSNVDILNDNIDSNLETVRTYITSNVDILNENIDSNLETTRTYITSNVNILNDNIDSNLSTVRDYITSNVNILNDNIDSNLETTRTYITSNVNILNDNIDSNISTVRDYISSNVQILNDYIALKSNILDPHFTSNISVESNVTTSELAVSTLTAGRVPYVGTDSFLVDHEHLTFTQGAPSLLSVGGDVNVSGNLFVQGSTTFLHTTNTVINDALVELANNNTSDTLDMGFIMTRPTSNVGLGFRGDESEFMIGHTLSDPSSADLVPDSGNDLAVHVYGSLEVDTTLAVDTDTLYVNATDDRVGVNTTTPGVALDVRGDANVAALSAHSNVDVGTDNFFVDTNTGRVGIGTTLPGFQLDVSGDANVATLNVYTIQGLQTLAFNSDNTTTPPLQLTAGSLNDGVGAIRIDSVEPDIYINDTDGGAATVTFANNDVARAAFGRNSGDDFYITVRDPGVDSGNWKDDTLVVDSSTGNITMAYKLGVNTTTFTGSNVLEIGGTANAAAYYGDGGLLSNIASTLDDVCLNGNTTTQVVSLLNTHTALTTDLTSNVEIKLDQLSNVVIGDDLTAEQRLIYDGANWVNDFNDNNFIRVINKTGADIAKGNTLYIVDSHNNNIANVALAKSDSSATMPCIGVASDQILNGTEGLAVTYGKVSGVNTVGFTQGQTLYVSNTAPGGIMASKPYDTVNDVDQIQNLGICIKENSENNGVIFVTGIGRSNDIPNANIVTQNSQLNYVYVNNVNNDMLKIDPTHLLTKLQTLQQVTDTGATTTNEVSFTNTDTWSIKASGNIYAASNITALEYYGDGTKLTGVALKTDLTDNAARVSVLEANVVDLWYNVYSNATILDGATSNISVLQSNVVDLWDNVYSNASTLATLKTDHEDNVLRMGVLETHVVDLWDNVYSNASTLATLKTDHEDNVLRVGVLEANVVDLWDNVYSNASTLATLKTDHEDNVLRIGVLETNVVDL